MANEENLKPFKEGYDPRRQIGRPKGSKNRSTVIKQVLETIFNGADPLTGKEWQDTYESVISRSIVKKALDGDVSAYNAIMDSAYGKARQTIDQTDNEIKGAEYDYLSADKKAKILALLSDKD